MVCFNQRSINDGVQKVVGSSNRGFITLDPERQQARIVTLPAKATATGSDAGEFRAPPGKHGTAPASGTSRR